MILLIHLWIILNGQKPVWLVGTGHTLALGSTCHGGESIMPDSSVSYRTRLSPWVVVRLLPRAQRIVVGRFYRRSDADGHLALLRRLTPRGAFVVVFDLGE